MLSKLLNNKAGDTADDQGYDVGYGYEEKKPQVYNYWNIGMVLVIFISYILIFVLFGVVGNIHKETVNNNYYSQVAASSEFLTSAASTISKGTVVSLTAAGAIQAGAGTSIYKNIVDFTAKCPSYVSMDAIYSNAYVVSYADKTATTATLQVVQVSTPNKGTVVTNMPSPYFLYDIVTLSDGLFVGITQDSDSTVENAFVMAGTVDAATLAITMWPVTQYANNYSMNPQLTRLSDSTFAIAYYNTYPSELATRYGSVDPTSKIITLSKEYIYGDNSHYSVYQGVVGMSASQYLLLNFDSYAPNTTSQSGGSGPLNVIVATVSGDLSAGTAELSFSNVTTLTGSALSYYFAATALSNDTAVVAFVDANQNYGINTQVVQLTADIQKQPVVFGASWLVTSGQALIDLSNWIMDLDVAKVSSAGDFMVLYSDISNNGAMTATSGQLTVSADLIRSSPDFVLNTGNSDVESVYSWGALATGISTPLNSQTAILTSLTNFDCAADAVSTFSLMEIMPAPFGVVNSVSVSSTNKNNKNMRDGSLTATTNTANIVLAGTIPIASTTVQLTPGMNYYANTMGEVISGGDFYGREGTSDYNAAYYYIQSSGSDGDETIVTLNSKIGVATATNAIYVQPK